MKNVLLLCMSPLNPKARITQYSYELSNGKTVSFEGVMTNEAPAKAVIYRLYNENRNNRLDKIVMICSDAVRKQIRLAEKENDLNKLSRINIEDCQQDSHIEFYKRLINNYAESIDSSYSTSSIQYDEIGISNFTEDDEVSRSVINAGNKVTDTDEEVNLFIDFNGGQRYVAFMILAIANLMKIRNVNIKQIMTMNFDNKVNGIVPIQNMEPVFASFDLISGINEYINYGRIKTLNNYFRLSKNKSIKKVLRKMEIFSNNLQLCRTGYIMDHREELLGMLKDYSENSNQKEPDTYDLLFEYVTEDILNGYDGLLTGELPDIIRWCVNRGFIQQALTFVSEEMPGYFWKTGIFKASQLEMIEYNNFLKIVHASSQNDYSSLKKHFRKEHPENSSKYAYEWMISYLPYSANEKYNREYRALFQDVDSSFRRLVFTGPSSAEVNRTKKSLGRFHKIDVAGINLRRDSINKAAYLAAPLIWHANQRYGRAVCGMTDKSLFNEIMVLYFLLKEQRNQTNHADSEIEESKMWTYDQLCYALRQMIDTL